MPLHDIICGLLQPHELRQQHAHLLLLLHPEPPHLIVQALRRLHHPHLHLLQALRLLAMLFSAVVVEGVGGLGCEECLFLHLIEFENEFPSP